MFLYTILLSYWLFYQITANNRKHRLHANHDNLLQFFMKFFTPLTKFKLNHGSANMVL